MSTIRANAILDSAGGNTATINGITPTDTAGVLSTFNASGSAPVYACRAWVNFNGTGTVAIRNSGNVSSITDNGVGEYTVNFATAMPDANYAVAVSARRTSTASSGYGTLSFSGGLPTTTGVAVASIFENGIASDSDIVCVAIFR